MEEVYATTFSLAAGGHESAYDHAIERLSRWSWERVGSTPQIGLFSPQEISENGWRLAWWQMADPQTTDQATSVSLTHPDRRDSSMLWRTRIELSHTGALTRATVRLVRIPLAHFLRPSRFAMRPPAIVARLLDAPLRGYAGAIEIRPVATRLNADASAEYVDDVLRHDERVLPCVVLASESSIQIPASELARRLVGLAHVAVLTDRDAVTEFRAAVGSERFVPPGGARIYWPGFAGGEDEPRHRYWTRAALRERHLDAELRALLARLSVGRVPDDPVPGRIRTAVARAALEELRAEGEVADTRGRSLEAAEARLRELQQRYDSLEQEAIEILERHRDLEEALAAANEERSRLTQRLATAEQNLEAAYRWQEDEAEESETEDSAEEAPPDSWTQLEERLDELVTPGFQFTDRARECARGNAYPSPRRMWDHLERLARAGEEYNDRGASIGNRFAEWAIQFGLDVALSDSTYSNTEFVYEGETLDRLPHVKIDDAVAPNEVGRIYFAIDSARARLVVDWFGVKRDRP